MSIRPIVSLLALACACNSSPPAATQPSASAVRAEKPEPPPEPSPMELVVQAPSLSKAIAISRSRFSDESNRMSPGAIMLTAWAMGRMTWDDVGVAKDETTHALVMKDSEEERGKRLCATGNLIQITTERVGQHKMTNGLLMTPGMKLFSFQGVGSSGTLVEGSRGRFCGVVIGRYDYSNSGGGTGHAVQLVGMFDIPENKTTQRERVN